MTIYNSKSNKKKLKKSKKLGIALVTIFSVLLLNLLFNIIKPLNSVFLGTFGLLSYGLFLTMLILGVCKILTKKEITISKKEIAYLFLILFSLVSILHIITTKSQFSTFSNYLSETYYLKVSAGGLFFSIFVYPIYFITHYVGSLIFFSILFLCFFALFLDKYIEKKNFNKLSLNKIFTNTTNENNSLNKNKEESVEKIKTYDNIQDDIFISDEAIQNKHENNNFKEKEAAKKILGISGMQNNSVNQESSTSQNDKSTIDIFKVTDTELIDKNLKAENIKPPKFFHDNENSHSIAYIGEQPQNLNLIDEKTRKNKEFLKSTFGNTSQKDDIYDKSFTKKQFNKEKQKYLSNLETINNSYNEVSKNFDNFQANKYEKYNENTVVYNNLNSRYNAYNQQHDNENFKNFHKEKNNSDSQNALKQQIKMNFNNSENPREMLNKKFNKQKWTYVKPPIDLLHDSIVNEQDSIDEYNKKKELLELTLSNFKIDAKVTTITRGPTFTRYELQMPPGIPVNKINQYVNDIAMNLESNGGVRIEIPIPGKNAFGVEVPNTVRDIVGLKEILESYNFQNSKSKLTFALGKDIAGECKIAKIDKMPHLLVAGATNSGKSVCLNALIISLLYHSSPDDVRLILIDPKQVEFTVYNDLPHLMVPKIITEIDKALNCLSWSIDEMERRFRLFAAINAKNIDDYNSSRIVLSGQQEKIPYIVIIIDEVYDLITQSKKEVEERIARLTAKSRAAGIHLILATQRPSVNVITGVIKANLPTRIAFAVTTFADSKTILDQGGAEKLLGKGDMLYFSQSPEMPRIQGVLVTNQEICDVVDFVKQNNEANFDSDIEDRMLNNKTNGYEIESMEDLDPLMKDALRLIIKTGSASISKLQRSFGIGYPKAGKIIDQMEKCHFISAPDNKSNREIFITEQEFEERFGEDI